MIKIPHSKRGFALIVTLGAIVLVTILLLAFFSRASLNLQISYSSTNQVKADLLCRSAANLVVGQLREEIRTGSTVLNGSSASYPAVYQPLDIAHFLPQRIGVSSPDSTGSATLVKVSGNHLALNANTSADSTRILGSSVATDSDSANGRALSATTWFGSGTGTGSPHLGAQGTLPTWVFLSRGRSVVPNPIVDAPASDPNYVVGRFAYVVYDLGGLLDANAAGSPSVATADAAYKSSLAGADLSQVPGAAPDTFVGWRNGADALSAPAYSAYLQDYGRKYGFLATKSGDKALFGRGDLINLAQNGSYGLASSSLGYLTHFTRSLNAPSWGPAKNAATIQSGGNATYAYKDSATLAASTNRYLPDVRFTHAATSAPGSTVYHYRDDGTKDTYAVRSGDALLQRRFSLARIAWLTPTGPAAGISADAIQAAFGLVWDGTNNRWIYAGPSGTTAQSTLETLAQIADETPPREPNFFELLKAGILAGSLGSSATAKTMASAESQTFDSSKDLQIIRIGANIIDSADNDNFPTLIAFGYSGRTVECAGTEDLPYFYGMIAYTMYNLTFPATVPITINHLDCYFAPLLINPHRPSPGTVGNGPTQLSLDIASGTLGYIYPNSNTMVATPNKNLASASGTAGLTAITVPGSTFADFRKSAAVVQSPSATSNSISALISYASGPPANAQIFRYFSYQNEAATYGVAWPMVRPTPPATTNIRAVFRNLIFRLQCPSGAGGLKTYSTLAGNENLDPAANGGIYNSTANSSFLFPGTYSDVGGSLAGNGFVDMSSTHYWNLTDPRTNRYGPALAWNVTTSNLPETTTANGMRANVPFAALTFPSPVGLWPQGGKSYATYNTPDPDGVFRPADGWLGNAANPYRQLTGTSLNTTDESRPVILQRPYRSVAELGYVFRDSAWKTLSFFDATSGDSALLDLFTVSDAPALEAGVASLDTRQPVTQQALFSGAAQHVDGTTPVTAANAKKLAAAYAAYAFSGDTALPTLPANLSQLADFISDNQTALTGAGLDVIKCHQETVARALAESTQTRTWNLLIDVTAQTGHYGPKAASAKDFIVEGEKRYWLSVAIDRYTGKVIDRQLEPANP